jgi:hypothetical protein
VLMAHASTWVDGCLVRPSGLLASTAAAWDLVDVCGWVVWGMCAARVLASAVVRSWLLATWDRSSAGSSLTSLFLGGISLVFCQACEHDGCKCWNLFVEGKWIPNKRNVLVNATSVRTGHVARSVENLATSQPPRARCPCRSIYSGRSMALLQCHKCP